MKIPIRFLVSFLLFVPLVGCFNPPQYPNTPLIRFEAISSVPNVRQASTGSLLGDSIKISLFFQDGNGDMGLSSSDAADLAPPFQQFALPVTPDSLPNPYHHNYWITIQKKVRGNFVNAIFNLPPSITKEYARPTLNGRYMRLSDGKKDSPIEGTLDYKFAYIYAFPDATTPRIMRGDTVRFVVKLIDRALNESNTITTDEVVLGQRKD